MKKHYTKILNLTFILFAFFSFNANVFGQPTIANGDFESWTGGAPDSWTTIEAGVNVTQETTIVHGGSSSASVEVTTGSQSDTDIRQNIDVVSGQEYTLTAWVYHTEGTQRVRWYIDGYYAGQYSDNTVLDQWQEYSIVYTASTTGSVEVGVRFYDIGEFDGSEIVYIDDLSITENADLEAPVWETEIGRAHV